MTDAPEPNPFGLFFQNVEMVGPIVVDEHDDGSIFDSMITREFEEEMAALAEQMPEDDEETANALMAQAVQRMMVNCFRAGMLFQEAITRDDEEQDPHSIQVTMSPEQAAQLVMGLVGNNGPTFRLVVDRGQD